MTLPASSIVAAATLALLCVSCSSQKSKDQPAADAPTRIQGVKHTNQHWIQGEQLQALMKTISAQKAMGLSASRRCTLARC